MQQLVIGFLLAVLIASGAYFSHSLNRSGALAAVLVGTVIFGLGGWPWAVVLLTFFLSSSLLTRLFKKQKAPLNEKYDKGGQRDAGQVLANGGLAAIFAGPHFFLPQGAWTWAAFTASLAAVNADTWATELGVLNPSQPRLITNLKQVERGTSGGISWSGILASLAGGGLVSLVAILVKPAPVGLIFFLIISLAGLLGSLFDSLLGATLQAIFFCPHCQKETERHPFHTCGTATDQIRGISWLNNDLVNLGCSLAGALLGLLVGVLLL